MMPVLDWAGRRLMGAGLAGLVLGSGALPGVASASIPAAGGVPVAPAALAGISGQADLGALGLTRTGLAGTVAYGDAPLALDMVHATAAALAAYGFPPRPDPVRAPAAYRSWRQAVDGVRRVVPVLQPVAVYHGPMRRAPGVPAGAATATAGGVANGVAATSANWSGYVVAAEAFGFGPESLTDVYGDWVVPVAQTAFGACRHDTPGLAVFSSTWVGLDGNGSVDVLQAGTESDASCARGTIGAFHSMWFEWYPYNEVRVTNLPIGPGSAVYVHVWATSATRGHAYLADKSGHKAISIAFDAPPGTALMGNSAEWVVERPQVDGALAPLTNYVQEFFAGAEAVDAQGRMYYPGAAQANGQQALAIQMENEGAEVISAPALIGPSAIWFMDQGSTERIPKPG